MYYVGIDWADQKYDIIILDHAGDPVSNSFVIKKDHQGFVKLLTRLRQLSYNPLQFKIGIETATNLLVDFLMELNYPVFVIPPGSMKSFRKRYRLSGARDDVFDAFVLADILRTDKRCGCKIDFGSDLIRKLRILVRDYHYFIAHNAALINSLRMTLKEYYPEYIHFFADVACTNSLLFLQAYPDFETASQLSHKQLNEFFKEHRLHDSNRINKIFKLLHQPHLKVSPNIVDTKKIKTIACTSQLMQFASTLKQYQSHITPLLHQHVDSKIFLSYPGVAEMLAARLLAFFGDNRQRYHDVRELQQIAGTCPVTEKTGKNYKSIYYRRACNKFYRDLMHNLAFSTLTKMKWAKHYYKKHRAKGKNHAHALRCLANLHLKILFAMWQNRNEYDENIFLARRTKHLIETENNVEI